MKTTLQLGSILTQIEARVERKARELCADFWNDDHPAEDADYEGEARWRARDGKRAVYVNEHWERFIPDVLDRFLR